MNIIDQIRELIQTPEAKYIFPVKYHILKENGKTYIDIHKWEKYPNTLVKQVLFPLTKRNIRFESFDAFRDWVITPGTLESMNTNSLKILYQALQSVQTSQYNTNQLAEIRALLNYERVPWFRGEPVENNEGKPLNDVSVETRIQRMLKKQEPLKKEKIVWRGQTGTELLPLSWFSTSTNKSIAKEYGNNLFKIHVQPGTKVIDLYEQYKKYGIKNPLTDLTRVRSIMHNSDYLQAYAANYSSYAEIIVEGGGHFYKDDKKIEPGFREVMGRFSCMSNTTCPKYYETYYFPNESNNVPEIEWKRNIYPVKNQLNTTRSSKRQMSMRMRNYNSSFTKKNVKYPTNRYNSKSKK